MIWDRKRGGGGNRVRKNLSAMMQERNREALLISPHSLRTRQLPKRATLLHRVSGDSVEERAYYIYRCPLSTTNAPELVSDR